MAATKTEDRVSQWQKPADPEKKASTVVVVYDSEAQPDLSCALYKFISNWSGDTSENRNQESGIKNQESYPIPLFLTPYPKASTRNGLSIPLEFVIGINAMEDIPARIRQLQAVHPDGIFRRHLRAMCVGAFRKALCLDDENHGRGEMDPFDLLRCRHISNWKINTRQGEKSESWPDHVIARIKAIQGNSGKSASEYGISDSACAAFLALFAPELDGVMKAMRAVQEA